MMPIQFFLLLIVDQPNLGYIQGGPKK